MVAITAALRCMGSMKLSQLSWDSDLTQSETPRNIVPRGVLDYAHTELDVLFPKTLQVKPFEVCE